MRQDAVAAAAARRGGRRRAESEPSPWWCEFAEQFSVDVSAISDELRARLASVLGKSGFRTSSLTFVADFVPRVRAGFEALGVPVLWAAEPTQWDHDSDPADLLFNDFCRGGSVARARSGDVGDRPAARRHSAQLPTVQIAARGNALDAGGSESLYAQIDHYETADALTDRTRRRCGMPMR